MPTADAGRRPAGALAIVLLTAAAVRLLGSVVAGFIAWSVSRDAVPDASVRAGNVLQTFGSAGDTAGALILVAGALVVAWGRLRNGRLAVTVRFLLMVTAVLVVLRVTGYFFVFAATREGGEAEQAVVTSIAIADLLLCAAGALALHLFGAVEAAAGADADPLVFAVDRVNGEVFAFFSYAEAARTLSVYSIADEEFDFYSDEGFVIDATVDDDDRARFEVTTQQRRDALVTALRAFARTRRLAIDRPDDPEAYAVPISDWQWLELWPGWMRGLGRLVGRFRRQVGRSKSIVE